MKTRTLVLAALCAGCVSAAETETVLIADVDAVQVTQARAKFPALKDRREGYSR